MSIRPKRGWFRRLRATRSAWIAILVALITAWSPVGAWLEGGQGSEIVPSIAVTNRQVSTLPSERTEQLVTKTKRDNRLDSDEPNAEEDSTTELTSLDSVVISSLDIPWTPAFFLPPPQNPRQPRQKLIINLGIREYARVEKPSVVLLI
jgi:hypothetical protein